MKKLFSILLLLFLITSCFSDKSKQSVNPYFKYFYPVDTIPKIYLFRDVAHGMDEQFYRIYSLNNPEHQYLIVEIYAADGRIIESLSYNTDSLDIVEHMVVNRNQEKTKAELFKNKLIPMNNSEEVWFASRFQGFLDSTLILKEVKRKIVGDEILHEVLGKQVPTIVMKDKIRLTNFNPFSKKETVLQGEAVNYFSEEFGLVEWHTLDKKVHYKLEKIMNQEEWLRIITR